MTHLSAKESDKTMKLIDSHAHYDDSRFDEEFEGGRDAALAISFEKGIEAVINVATNLENAKTTLALAEKYENIYAAVGFHPTDCQQIPENEISSSLLKIEELTENKKVVAIGEIGLDYHYDDTNRERQIFFFERQLDMAKRLDLPVIIHDRDAHGDCMDIVRRHIGVKGVFHSFSGSTEMAKELLSLGWYISFGGPVTYKNANKVKKAAEAVPLDKLLIETDAPYLPPVPHRGEINYSAYMFHTLKGLSEATGYDEQTLARATTENAKRLFNI